MGTSIKLYGAVRFKQERLNEFLGIVRKHALAQTEAKCLELLKYIERSPKIEESVQQAIAAQKHPPDEAKIAEIRRWYAVDHLWELFREGARQSRRTIFDIECGWNLWFHKGMVYAIPWGPDWTHRNLTYPEWVEDYGYWNNYDKPEGITSREWAHREKTWDAIIGKSHDATRLTHTILEFANWQETACRLQLKLQEEWTLTT